MDRLDLFSLVSEAFPRLVAAIVVVALLVCPSLVSSELISIARERGEVVAAELDRILLPRRDHHPEGRQVRARIGGPHQSGER